MSAETQVFDNSKNIKRTVKMLEPVHCAILLNAEGDILAGLAKRLVILRGMEFKWTAPVWDVDEAGRRASIFDQQPSAAAAGPHRDLPAAIRRLTLLVDGGALDADGRYGGGLADERSVPVTPTTPSAPRVRDGSAFSALSSKDHTDSTMANVMRATRRRFVRMNSLRHGDSESGGTSEADLADPSGADPPVEAELDTGGPAALLEGQSEAPLGDAPAGEPSGSSGMPQEIGAIDGTGGGALCGASGSSDEARPGDSRPAAKMDRALSSAAERPHHSALRSAGPRSLTAAKSRRSAHFSEAVVHLSAPEVLPGEVQSQLDIESEDLGTSSKEEDTQPWQLPSVVTLARAEMALIAEESEAETAPLSTAGSLFQTTRPSTAGFGPTPGDETESSSGSESETGSAGADDCGRDEPVRAPGEDGRRRNERHISFRNGAETGDLAAAAAAAAAAPIGQHPQRQGSVLLDGALEAALHGGRHGLSPLMAKAALALMTEQFPLSAEALRRIEGDQGPVKKTKKKKRRKKKLRRVPGPPRKPAGLNDEQTGDWLMANSKVHEVRRNNFLSGVGRISAYEAANFRRLCLQVHT